MFKFAAVVAAALLAAPAAGFMSGRRMAARMSTAEATGVKVRRARVREWRGTV